MKKPVKAVVSVPGWAEAMMEGETGDKNNIRNPVSAYAYVPIIFRAVNIRCNALIRPKVVLNDKAGNVVPWMFTVSPKDLLWKTEASLLLTGANYIEKLNRRLSGRVADLHWVNPTTMEDPKLVKNYETGKLDYIFKQKSGGTWTLQDMIYIRDFSLSDDVTAGVSSGAVALNDASLIRYMSRAVSKFFETGMMPVTLLQVPGIADEDEIKRIEGFFKRLSTGIRNMWRVLALGTEGADAKVISQPLKDMVIPEVYIQAERSVAHAFGFNPALFDQAANRATATEYRLSLYQDVVEPRGDWLMEQLNDQLFKDMGLTASLDYSVLDVYQEDEANRADSLQAITNAINVNPSAAIFVMKEILGYDLTQEQLAKFNDMFVPDNNPPESAPSSTPKSTDLAKWQRKSLKLLQKGKSPACDFTSDYIEEPVSQHIREGLELCKTPEDVKNLFSTVGNEQAEVLAILQGIRDEVYGISRKDSQ